ncbi:MAG TPA: methyl-accepting chemotaxis protein, partial [Luteitalea sp.]|nr:methyl-accepting chemotaxis protein [Luteitalea sp.]
MNTWSIGKKIGATAGASGLVILTLAGVSFWSVRSLQSVIDSAYDVDVRKAVAAGALDEEGHAMLAKEEAIVSSALQQDASQLAADSREFDVAAEGARAALADMDRLVETDAERQALQHVKSLVAQWGPMHAELVSLLKAGNVQGAVQLQNGRLDDLIDRVDEGASKLREEFMKTNEASNVDADRLVTRSLSALGVMALAGLAAAGLALLVVRQASRTLRDVTSELAQGASQVASASGQVAGAANQLSRGATQQAASLEETSASMEEMASMTRQNAANSHQAATMMADTERLVHDAEGALGAMVGSMTAIKDSSDKVAKIIKTIDEIAFQTNILALNAAVEAARAGESGMGFAVVAEEVRALAQRSAQAARDTAELIEESIARSAEGQQKVQLVSTAISSITASTTSMKNLVDGVSIASRQQSQGIDQVTQAVSQMEKVTQETAATAEESAAASEELSAQASTSMRAVARLGALVNGANATSVIEAAPTSQSRRGAGKLAAVAPATPAPRPVEAPRAAQWAGASASAEDFIPLDDDRGTGTFGRF